jgi:hypothetical protein
MDTQNSLTELTTIRSDYPDPTETENPAPLDVSIVRTVKVEHEDVVPKDTSTQIIDLQHPWMGR